MTFMLLSQTDPQLRIINQRHIVLQDLSINQHRSIKHYFPLVVLLLFGPALSPVWGRSFSAGCRRLFGSRAVISSWWSRASSCWWTERPRLTTPSASPVPPTLWQSTASPKSEVKGQQVSVSDCEHWDTKVNMFQRRQVSPWRSDGCSADCCRFPENRNTGQLICFS